MGGGLVRQEIQMGREPTFEELRLTAYGVAGESLSSGLGLTDGAQEVKSEMPSSRGLVAPAIDGRSLVNVNTHRMT